MEPKIEKKVLALCEAKSAVDDELGRNTDHEGDKDGPTWHLFTTYSTDEYEAHVARTVARHKRAMFIMRRLLRIKRTGR